MKPHITLIAGTALLFSVGLATAAERPVHNSTTAQISSDATDLSASQKKRRAHVRVYHEGPYVMPFNPYYLGPYNAVPSFGYRVGPDGYPGEYAYRRSLGQCVFDLGYGRFEPC